MANTKPHPEKKDPVAHAAWVERKKQQNAETRKNQPWRYGDQINRLSKYKDD